MSNKITTKKELYDAINSGRLFKVNGCRLRINNDNDSNYMFDYFCSSGEFKPFEVAMSLNSLEEMDKWYLSINKPVLCFVSDSDKITCNDNFAFYNNATAIKFITQYYKSKTMDGEYVFATTDDRTWRHAIPINLNSLKDVTLNNDISEFETVTMKYI